MSSSLMPASVLLLQPNKTFPRVIKYRKFKERCKCPNMTTVTALHRHYYKSCSESHGKERHEEQTQRVAADCSKYGHKEHGKPDHRRWTAVYDGQSQQRGSGAAALTLELRAPCKKLIGVPPLGSSPNPTYVHSSPQTFQWKTINAIILGPHRFVGPTLGVCGDWVIRPWQWHVIYLSSASISNVMFTRLICTRWIH